MLPSRSFQKDISSELQAMGLEDLPREGTMGDDTVWVVAEDVFAGGF